MSQKPFRNAAAALLYILAVVSTLFLVFELLPESDQGGPVVLWFAFVLSMFVLSAAVMGYIFLGYPLRMYLDDKKDEAVKLFLSTLGYFALLILGLVLAASLVQHSGILL